MDDLSHKSATELSGLIRDRKLSSRELLDHYIDRIERLNPPVNAVVTLDVERARQRAAALDERLMLEGPVGPLHGLPMTVKVNRPGTYAAQGSRLLFESRSTRPPSSQTAFQ